MNNNETLEAVKDYLRWFRALGDLLSKVEKPNFSTVKAVGEMMDFFSELAGENAVILEEDFNE